MPSLSAQLWRHEGPSSSKPIDIKCHAGKTTDWAILGGNGPLIKQGLEMFIGFDGVMETHREILPKSYNTDNELWRLPFKKQNKNKNPSEWTSCVLQKQMLLSPCSHQLPFGNLKCCLRKKHKLLISEHFCRSIGTIQVLWLGATKPVNYLETHSCAVVRILFVCLFVLSLREGTSILKGFPLLLRSILWMTK